MTNPFEAPKKEASRAKEYDWAFEKRAIRFAAVIHLTMSCWSAVENLLKMVASGDGAQFTHVVVSAFVPVGLGIAVARGLWLFRTWARTVAIILELLWSALGAWALGWVIVSQRTPWYEALSLETVVEIVLIVANLVILLRSPAFALLDPPANDDIKRP